MSGVTAKDRTSRKMQESQRPTHQGRCNSVPRNMRDRSPLITKNNKTDEDGFVYPRNTIKKRRMAIDSRVPTSISQSNSYESLSNVDMEDSDPIVKSQHSSRPKPQLNQSPNNSFKKQKPIVVSNITNDHLQRMLKAIKCPFTYAKKRDGTFHIHSTSGTDKKAILLRLTEAKIESHTFTEPEDRHAVFVLRNHFHMDPNQLLEKLKSVSIPAVRVDFIVDSANPLYKVQFAKNSITLNTLNKQHGVIEKLRVSWELKRNDNKRLTRCSNCQRWGHASSNCTRTYRCIKCLENHTRGECKRTNIEIGEPSCVNCGKTGHPSNSKTCEVFLKYKKLIDDRRRKAPQQEQPRKFNSTPAPWTNNINQNSASEYSRNFPSLPSATSSSHVQHVKEASNLLPSHTHFFQKNASNSYRIADLQADFASIPNLDEVLEITRNIIAEMKSANSPLEAAQVLLKFLSMK